jgi:choline dehydrogenase-like flavoprotein
MRNPAHTSPRVNARYGQTPDRPAKGSAALAFVEDLTPISWKDGVRYFLAEWYTTGPQGEHGWTIQGGWIQGGSVAQVREAIASLSNLDSIVDVYQANPNVGDGLLARVVDAGEG